MIEFILHKYKLRYMKGVSPLIAMVLVIAFGVAAMAIVLTVVNPMLDRAKDSGIVNEATQNMQLLDSAIKAVASEAKGSKRTIHIKITDGVLRSDIDKELLYLDFEPKTRTILDGFAGDVRIESRPVFLEYFNQYNDNDNANNTWTSVNGTWSISSGRFLGTGGIAYHNVGNQQGFDISASVVPSTAPNGQMYVVPGDPTNLVLYLPFDGNVNTSIATAYDYSAYKNNGTLVNSPTWVDGKFGNATKYDGINNNYVDAGNSSSLNITGALTLSAWVKGTFDSTFDHFAGTGRENAGNNLLPYALGYKGSTTQRIMFSLAYGGDVSVTDCSANTLGVPQNDTWYYVVGVFDGVQGSGKTRIYINGNLDTSCTSNANNITNIYYTFRIGHAPDVYNPFNGTIDEVMLFNRNLSASEVSFLYESGIKKVTTAGEIPNIGTSANVSIVLASPGSNYFDNIKLKAGSPNIRFVIPYQKIDIENQVRFGPGDHNIVINHNGTNTTTGRPIIRIGE